MGSKQVEPCASQLGNCLPAATQGRGRHLHCQWIRRSSFSLRPKTHSQIHSFQVLKKKKILTWDVGFYEIVGWLWIEGFYGVATQVNFQTRLSTYSLMPQALSVSRSRESILHFFEIKWSLYYSDFYYYDQTPEATSLRREKVWEPVRYRKKRSLSPSRTTELELQNPQDKEN